MRRADKRTELMDMKIRDVLHSFRDKPRNLKPKALPVNFPVVNYSQEEVEMKTDDQWREYMKQQGFIIRQSVDYPELGTELCAIRNFEAEANLLAYFVSIVSVVHGVSTYIFSLSLSLSFFFQGTFSFFCDPNNDKTIFLDTCMELYKQPVFLQAHERCWAAFVNDACHGLPAQMGETANAIIHETEGKLPHEPNCIHIKATERIQASETNPVPVWVSYGNRYS